MKLRRMFRNVSCVAFICCFVLASCASRPTPNPANAKVIIDNNFDADLIESMIEGANEWPERVSLINVSISVQSHAEIESRIKTNPGFDTIYVVRSANDSSACAYPPDPTDEGTTVIGFTRFVGESSAIICIPSGTNFDQRHINSEWKTVMMHEMGHAFSLKHAPDSWGRVVMRKMLKDQPSNLTCSDAMQFCVIWECYVYCSW